MQPPRGRGPDLFVYPRMSLLILLWGGGWGRAGNQGAHLTVPTPGGSWCGQPHDLCSPLKAVHVLHPSLLIRCLVVETHFGFSSPRMLPAWTVHSWSITSALGGISSWRVSFSWLSEPRYNVSNTKGRSFSSLSHKSRPYTTLSLMASLSFCNSSLFSYRGFFKSSIQANFYRKSLLCLRDVCVSVCVSRCICKCLRVWVQGGGVASQSFFFVLQTTVPGFAGRFLLGWVTGCSQTEGSGPWMSSKWI